MIVLLDTHVVLWWLQDDLRRLTTDAVAALEDPLVDIVVSAVCVWEIAIKRSIGKLAPSVPDELERLEDAIGVRMLPVMPRHANHVANLPYHHRDPFDRLLVAQAQLERLPIVTVDPRIRKYDVETIG